MKNYIIIISCFLLCTGFVANKEIIKSKQIHVKFEEYSTKGKIMGDGYYSNEVCKHSFKINENSHQITLVNFKDKTVNYNCLFADQEHVSTNTFSELDNMDYSAFAKMIGSDFEVPEYEIEHTNKTKVICGIECKHLIATFKDTKSEVYYFKPKKIKGSKINKHCGFYKIDGVIMEISVNGELKRKTIQIDNQWFE